METIERKLQTLKLLANNYTTREETLDGEPHLVVPVVMMVEGVHEGNQGPVLHQASELSTTVGAWNGIPVTISHPKKGEEFISANSPGVLDESGVGRIFYATYRGGLRAEAWINIEKISVKSPEAYQAILDSQPMEVSVGVFNDIEEAQEGAEWNGETYGHIASNYKPDHLALLPGEEGACSWSDGCGLRVNKKGGTMPEALLTTFKELNAKGYAVTLLDNAQGYREILEALKSKINALDTEDSYHYVEGVFDDYVVYRKRTINGGGDNLYRQGYDMDENGNVSFNGLVSEVRRNVEYVSYKKMKRAKPNVNSKNKGGSMSKDGTLCCEAKVDELISNKRTHWQPKDREWLLEQSEGTIAKMSPMAPEVVEQTAEEIQANNAKVIEDYNKGKKTIEDFTKDMPEEMKLAVNGGVKLYNERREALVKGIIANTAEGVWEEEALNAMDDKTLENIAKTVQTPADYSAQGAGGGNATSGEQVEIPVEYAGDGKEEK
jgi:hypothetical protein